MLQTQFTRCCVLIAAMILSLQASRAEELKSADAVLDRHLTAIGGKAKVLAVKTTEQFSLMTASNEGGQNLQGSVELYVKSPDHMLLVQRLPKVGESRMGYDGAEAWMQDQTGTVRVLEGQEKESVKSLAQYDRFARYQEHFPERKLKGMETLNKRKVYVLRLSPETGRPWMVYIDAESFLIVGMTMEVVGANDAKTQIQTVYTDYRAVEGVLMPFRRVQKMGGLTVVFQVNKIRVNQPISDDLFKAPVTQAPDVMTDE